MSRTAELIVEQNVLADVSISNGLVWTEDQATMYYIDSLTYEVAAFDYDVDTGDIANRRVVVEIPEAHGLLDGMSIDAKKKNESTGMA